MTTVSATETLFFYLFAAASFVVLWRLYAAATETHREATKGIREFGKGVHDVCAKGKELCENAKVFFGNEENRKKLKEIVVETLAQGVKKGLLDARKEIAEEESPRREINSGQRKMTKGVRA